MPNKLFFLLGFSILMFFDVLTQISLKLASQYVGHSNLSWHWFASVLAHPWVYVAMIGYLGAFVTWLTLLRRAPVGPAYVVTHLEIVGVLVVSAYLFGDVLSSTQLIGASLIVAGVIILGWGEIRYDK